MPCLNSSAASSQRWVLLTAGQQQQFNLHICTSHLGVAALCASLVHTQLISRSGLWDWGTRKGRGLTVWVLPQQPGSGALHVARGVVPERNTLHVCVCCSCALQLVEAGELPAALQLARSQLTPLADKHPELLPCLKASMALLLPGPAAGGSNGSAELSSKLWDVLLPLLQAKLGIQPPQLVSLLQVCWAGRQGHSPCHNRQAQPARGSLTEGLSRCSLFGSVFRCSWSGFLHFIHCCNRTEMKS